MAFFTSCGFGGKNRVFQRCCQICGEISCQFLALGGSMGPRYVLQLLFSEKSQDRLKNEQPLELENKQAQI
jgi:hypothetical protein